MLGVSEQNQAGHATLGWVFSASQTQRSILSISVNTVSKSNFTPNLSYLGDIMRSVSILLFMTYNQSPKTGVCSPCLSELPHVHCFINETPLATSCQNSEVQGFYLFTPAAQLLCVPQEARLAASSHSSRAMHCSRMPQQGKVTLKELHQFKIWVRRGRLVQLSLCNVIHLFGIPSIYQSLTKQYTWALSAILGQR